MEREKKVLTALVNFFEKVWNRLLTKPNTSNLLRA